MSDSNAIILMMAVALPQVFVYWFVDRWMWNRADTIATGVAKGVALSTEYRRLLLGNAWFVVVAGGIGGQVVLGVMWMMVGLSASSETVGLIAYLTSFFTGIGVLGWLYRAPFTYSHLAAIVRQAEAD